ncbi:asparagine synthase (glutamine-hydrolysing) [[Emmonsia] crescens]|uniref:Asparagine synthase (Glutamine-hydrolysing) n=1 Tax=[Emmonsia] crescens TaxID=73230 RepID=A0A0G2J3U9_9EURO|nr:asparagine synthase (glutamine-hydrolysing) [Emmonsia crescens UAMH 3008]
MCGIYFSLSAEEYVQPDEETTQLLRNRGPDSLKGHTFQLQRPEGAGQNLEGIPSSLYLTYISTVLALRGDHIQAQPIVDPASQSVLCWNGEAWKIHNNPVQGNDAQCVFQLLLKAVQPSDSPNSLPSSQTSESQYLVNVAHTVGAISGPFSFVFYDGYRQRIFYGRDRLGRRALLSGWDNTGSFKISSVCDGTSSKHFEEVETDGIHMIDLARLFQSPICDDIPSNSLRSIFTVKSLGWKNEIVPSTDGDYISNDIPPMNKSLPIKGISPLLQTNSPSIETLELKLRESLKLRVSNIPEPPLYSSKYRSKVAVLFSGGLDCTILARLAHDILHIDEPIDLLNVAFENPRVAAAAATLASKPTASLVSTYEACPDRITGRSSHAELQNVCPGRPWRFVAINIPYTETLNHRGKVRRLMRPHNTEMDLSIACALYFASRGQGVITSDTDHHGSMPYTTTARVLLSGLGADEVFAGYTRHATAFNRHGFQALVDEIVLDVGRLGKRNLGRDDRVICHWGREARYPYLDEDLLAWALACPVWEKCGFGAVPSSLAGTPDKIEELGGEQSLEPGKRSLRLLAWKLGMKNVAREKKRAIQFGSRTAKMESGRSKGTQALP